MDIIYMPIYKCVYFTENIYIYMFFTEILIYSTMNIVPRTNKDINKKEFGNLNTLSAKKYY